MVVSTEQKMNQMEIELQAMKEVLQKVSRLQLENTQAISESDTPGEAGGLMSVTAPRADMLDQGCL